MRNFKKLSREELKNITGGKACSIAIQGSDGKWITRTGTCAVKVEMIRITDDFSIPTTRSYCETGLGDIPISSNGGVSRCN